MLSLVIPTTRIMIKGEEKGIEPAPLTYGDSCQAPRIFYWIKIELVAGDSDNTGSGKAYRKVPR